MATHFKPLCIVNQNCVEEGEKDRFTRNTQSFLCKWKTQLWLMSILNAESGERDTSNQKAAEIIFIKIFIKVTGLCESECFLISYPPINWHQAIFDTDCHHPQPFISN